MKYRILNLIFNYVQNDSPLFFRASFETRKTFLLKAFLFMIYNKFKIELKKNNLIVCCLYTYPILCDKVEKAILKSRFAGFFLFFTVLVVVHQQIELLKTN